jgi:SAM-dependent methyltransferase
MSQQSPDTEFDPGRYWEQRLSERYTLGATGWSGLGESFNRWSYAVRRRVFQRVVRDVVRDPSALTVLDVGSGTGFYLEAWRALGVRELVGSDLTSAAVDQLTARFPGTQIHRLDIGAPERSLAEAQFDVISIIDVLYHIVDDARYEQALQNLAAMLKPGGILLFSENFVSERQAGKHQINRTSDALEGVLTRAGLTSLRRWPVFFLMNTPVASESRLLDAWWRGVVKLAGRSDATGWLLGATLLPIEVVLSRIRRDGPSTKLAACWRR